MDRILRDFVKKGRRRDRKRRIRKLEGRLLDHQNQIGDGGGNGKWRRKSKEREIGDKGGNKQCRRLDYMRDSEKNGGIKIENGELKQLKGR